ncbi:MAG TPA: hypothetical protein VFJ82_14870 [Longimicrobium sp.]|nr:hypothetical protein [Longimicrobium sp.]
MTAATPPFPEAALRAVLAGTVAAWAGSSSAGDEPRRLYLDGFAGAEFQFGTGVARSGDDETRVAAAVRALDGAASEPPPTAVFIEEDPAHLGRIYAELEDSAGGERLRATRDLASLQPGEISLLEAPFASVAAQVAPYAVGARTFALLAPPAARALPWDALRPLAALPDATLLIRLPHSDWEKQSRHTGPLADLPGFARRIVEGCSALLDDPKHAWLPAWRAEAAASGPAAAFAGVLKRFHALLDGVAAGRILKPMQLEGADGAAAWLFLLTPDPAVALAANAAVRAARLVDHAGAATPIAVPTAAAVASPTTSSPPAETTPAASSPAETTPAASSTAEATPATTVPASDAAPSVADTSDATVPASAATTPSPTTATAEDALVTRPRKKGRRGAASPSAASSPAPGPSPPAESAAQAHRAEKTPAPTAAVESAGPAASPAAPATPKTPTRPPIPPPARPEPVAEFLDLFPEQIEQPEYLLPVRRDPAELAATLEARFAGTTVAWRDILRAHAATDVTPAELKAALAVLRRAGRAAYKALKKDDDAVDFPAEPIVREKPKRAPKAADDGGLFGERGE